MEEKTYQINNSKFLLTILVLLVLSAGSLYLFFPLFDFNGLFFTWGNFFFYLVLSLVFPFFAIVSTVKYLEYQKGITLGSSGISVGNRQFIYQDIENVEISKRGPGFYVLFDLILSLLAPTGVDTRIETKEKDRAAVMRGYKNGKQIFKVKLRPDFAINNVSEFKEELRKRGVKVS
jgi:hypothetical protein